MNKVEKVLLDTERFGAWCRSDPLAAAILLEPQVATQIKEVYVSVELHGANIRGAMVVDHLQKLRCQPNVRIVERVNTDLYQKLLLEAFATDMVRS
jgi:inosine-uridine nucleoside N-ribohydrolase